jgi:flagellar basal body-associated protein FliL
MVKLIGISAVAALLAAAATYFLVTPSAPAEAAEPEAAVEAQPELVEVPIDTFNTSNRSAAAGSVIHVRFNLVATVPRGHEVALDDAVTRTMPARIRQAVMEVARSSSLDDLKDPELSVLKRKVKEEINKVLRKSLVSEVIISEFRTMEQ